MKHDGGLAALMRAAHLPVGRMLEMKLNRIIIFVGNPRACAELYRDAFDLNPIGEWSDEWAELDGNGCRLAFHQAYGEAGKLSGATGSPDNPHKIVFTVDNVPRTRQRLLEKGIEMGDVHDLPELNGLVLCDGSDPEGHRFQICNR
ncbi:MAG: hypothetical protein HN742_02395 [Lentisphaerae bacterium]|nr:hypothetical protein [Lentisphaerota bacterium]MBT4818957.1 hypothetical protein [Lentisphaerota bacterium]MBT5605304.1 hypothetical protein [Lentisphaerota bacterium]MBT7057546.1 hypothetical protein [Lentisphaerota bacterium]MBT7840688.1 hypothetical protein [Lentisphaerota bacterium]